MKKLIQLILFIPILLISQNVIHYPFCPGYGHSQSNCRAYAMASAYGGNYCGGDLENICSPDGISGAMWETTTYSGALAGTDGWNIIAWAGENASQHAAYFDFKSYNYLTSQWTVSAYHIPNVGGSISFVSNIEDITGKGDITHLIRKVPVWDFKVENEFTGNTGGNVKIQGTIYPSPKSIDNKHWGSPYIFEAIYDNDYFNGHKWFLYAWKNEGVNESSQIFYNAILTTNSTANRQVFTASYKKLWQVTFENEFSGGDVLVEGQSTPAPVTTEIEEDDYKTVKAINYQSINNIGYHFNEWKENGQTVTTDIEYDFTPNNNTTYTAHFTGYPTTVSDFQFDCAIGDPVHFTWDQYPNSNVQYKIWRKVKNQYTGVITESVIATLPNSTTQYTDENFTRSRTYNTYLLHYCVRTNYTPDQTLGPLSYQGLYGGSPAFKTLSEQTPNSYSISNYPNPFNATTTIYYALPEESKVKFTLYDFLGREIKTLVNRNFNSGLKKIIWDGTDQNDNPVSSGMYFYHITANSLESDNTFSKNMKMVLLK